jgi:dihydrofolate reductase
MKTFIIAATSADGFIARDTDQSSFTWNSPEDKARFIRLTKEAGVIVMGSTTFATMPKPLKDRRNIVYSRTPEKYAASIDPKFAGVEVTDESPAALVARLASEGAHGLAICGGSQIYTLFMKAAVVDTVYLTVEPVTFGSGIPLFTENFADKMKLVSTGTLPSGTKLLEYEVKR